MILESIYPLPLAQIGLSDDFRNESFDQEKGESCPIQTLAERKFKEI